MSGFRFELEVVDALMAALGLGRSVTPFALPYVGRTHVERAAHVQRAMGKLAERGYAVDGELADEVEDLIRAWHGPEVLVTMDATEFESGTCYLYRSGWSGKIGFHSYQDGDAVVIEQLRPAQVPQAVATMLPAAQKFFGKRAVAIVDDPSVQHDPDAEDVLDDGRDSGKARVHRRDGNIDVFFQHTFHRTGILSLSAADGGGPLARRETLSWADTDNGRFAIVSEPVGDGTLRRTFEPTDGGLVSWWIADRAT